MLTFYAGSGSAPTWRVWLTLEHKQVPYTLDLLSFQAGDLRRPSFLALNPRAQVPAIVDDEFALYESSAICEYLEERYPERPLLPAEPRARAVVRRLAAEAVLYVGTAVEALMAITLYGMRPASPEELEEKQGELGAELARWEPLLAGPYLAGTALSMADLALYPALATIRRLDVRQPARRAGALIGPRAAAWMARIEALSYFDRTYPPHWRS